MGDRLDVERGILDPLSPVDPRRLLVLRIVAQTGSFAGAARRLGWTQPAVSQQIHRLEQEVGAPLVRTTTRGAVLNDAALSLVRHADAIASRLEAVAEEAVMHRPGASVRLRLAAFPSASKALVLSALSTLARTRPDVTTSLLVAEPDEARTLVRSGEADLAVVFAYGAEIQPPDLERRELMHERVLLTMPSEHPLAASAELTLRQLAGERWIGGCPRCRGNLQEACVAAGFEPDIRHRLDDFVLVQHMVADGFGLALLPSLAFATFRHPGVVVRSLPGLGSRVMAAETRADGSAVPAIGAVIDALSAAASSVSDAT